MLMSVGRAILQFEMCALAASRRRKVFTFYTGDLERVLSIVVNDRVDTRHLHDLSRFISCIACHHVLLVDVDDDRVKQPLCPAFVRRAHRATYVIDLEVRQIAFPVNVSGLFEASRSLQFRIHRVHCGHRVHLYEAVV